MSEKRALRDKLEKAQAELLRTKVHLEKLQAHQARELEALQQELEETRREAALLRVRLEEAEARKSSPQQSGELALPESLREVRSRSAVTALVALVRLPPSLSGALPPLARLLRLDPADVRFRLSAPPPTILARLPVREAEALREALRAEGFAAVSCEVAPRMTRGPLAVRRFVLDEQQLYLESGMGERRVVRYEELRLMVRGQKTLTTVETQDEVDHDDVKRSQTEDFLWLYGDTIRAAFSLETSFESFGAQRGPTRYDSLQRLMEELRRRAPRMVIDERFMQLSRISLLLVDEDRSQELLAELLFQAIREGLWP